jgi:hypothetical protein
LTDQLASPAARSYTGDYSLAEKLIRYQVPEGQIFRPSTLSVTIADTAVTNAALYGALVAVSGARIRIYDRRAPDSIIWSPTQQDILGTDTAVTLNTNGDFWMLGETDYHGSSGSFTTRVQIQPDDPKEGFVIPAGGEVEVQLNEDFTGLLYQSYLVSGWSAFI